jgi:hypothetical protein
MAKLVRMKLKIKIESNNKVMPFDQSGDQNVSEIDLKYEEKTNLSLKYMKMISDDVFYLKKSNSDSEKDTELLIKWIFAAKVIDRFLFYLTLIYSLSTFIGIILVDPDFYNFN